MKTLKQLCLALSLSFAINGMAHADYGHHRHNYGHHSHGRHHNHFSGGNAALLTIAGVAIGATAYRYYEPAPVYVPAPRVIYSPPTYSPPSYAAPVAPASWYFCGSSGQYYPYARHCPEGWQAVPAQ